MYVLGSVAIGISLILTLFIFLPLLSSEPALKKQYLLGDKIKIEMPGNAVYVVEIITPTHSYKDKVSKSFLFKPEEIGEHIILIDNIEYARFDVVDKLSISEENISDMNLSMAEKMSETEEGNKKQVRLRATGKAMYVYKLSKGVRDKNSLKLQREGNFGEVAFEANDRDGDGLIDTLVWQVDAGESTFSIIIITKAEHLDENRTFLEDVYDLVNTKDGVFSEIPGGDYLRVNFEKNLTPSNDITIYARSNDSASVEVYEKDSDIKIADFGIVNEDKKYQIFLNNMSVSQDSFDLKVVGGSVEFDYVVDPTINIRAGVGTDAGAGVTISFNTAMPSTSYVVLLSGLTDTDTMYSMTYSTLATGSFLARAEDDTGTAEVGNFNWIVVSSGEYDYNNNLVKCGAGPLGGGAINFVSNFPDANYAVVANVVDDDDSPTVNFVAASKAVGGFSIDIEDDGGANEAVTGSNYCAFDHGEYSLGGNNIKAGSTTTAAAGDTTVNFGTAFSSANYAVIAMAQAVNGALCSPEIVTKSTGSFTIHFEEDTSTNCASKNFDWVAVMYEGFDYSDDSTLIINAANSPYLFCGEVDQHTSIIIQSDGVASICQFNGAGTGYANITLGTNGNFTLESGGIIDGVGDGANGGLRVTAAATCATQGTDGETGSAGASACTANGGGGGGGNRVGTGDSAGGGGGAFGSSGGVGGYSAAGTKGSGGGEYGSNSSEVLLIGSGGGGAAGDGTGGIGSGSRGGAGLKIDAGTNGNISIQGSVNLSGAKGTNGDATDDSGGGGGSGGHIILLANILDISSSNFSVDGGSGGDAAGTTTSDSCGGGGGSGGRIVYSAQTIINSSSIVGALGGAAGIGTDAACDNVIDPGASSAGNDGTIYFNDKSPLVTINLPANTTYNNASFPLNFNVSLNENGSTMFSLDSGSNNFTMLTLSGSIFGTLFNYTNTSISDGSYTFRVYSNDTNGNRNDSISVNFSVDSTPPSINVNSPSPNNSNYSNSSVLFNVTLDGNASSCRYNLDLGNNISMTSTDNLTWNATNASVTDGLHTAYFYCNDSVNNTGRNSTVFRIDTYSPSVIISLPQAVNYTTDELNINFSSTDLGIGVDSCWYSIDGGATNTTIVNCENTTFTSPQGTNTLIVYSNDTLGNINASVNVTYFVDSVNPLVQFIPTTALNATGSEKDWIYVNISLTEINLANITYTLYNDTNLVNQTTYNSSITKINWTGLDNNYFNYTYNVTVFDILGNTNNTETRYLQLTPGDVNPPNVFFNIPTPNGYYYNTSSVYIEVYLDEEGHTVLYSLNNSFNSTMQTLDNLTWNATNSSVSDGSYTLTVYANDSLGNLGLRERNFSVDTLYPLIDYLENTLPNSSNVSRSWIFVNVSVTEPNLNYINFTLYGLGGLVNATSYNDGTSIVNWTGLSDGDYQYNASVADFARNINYTQTRDIRLDTTVPSAFLPDPQNNSYVNNMTQNLTVNVSDNLGLYNGTLLVYNLTSIINQTELNLSGMLQEKGVVFNFSYGGNFSWQYIIRDSAGNSNITSNNTIIVDTTDPLVSFINSTENNASDVEIDWIFANVTISETNFANVTYTLFNSTGLVNQTTYSSLTTEINWTDLNSANVTYYYNVTVVDRAGNTNYTETRVIRLVDINTPYLNLINPQNKTYYYNESLPLDYDVSDIHIDACWYNVDGGMNISLPLCVDTTFNVTEGGHTLYLFANDTLGLVSSANVTFIANSSLLQRRKGLLAYGEGTVATPRYRIWNGTGFGEELNSSNVVGTMEWIRVGISPSRDEHIILTANTSDSIVVQINGTLSNGTACWHNGTTCGNALILQQVSTTVNRQKMDVAYETTGEDALIVWSQGNTTPLYRVWNGSEWGATIAIPQSLLNVGVISYLKLSANPNSEEIALIMTNTSALTAIVWNGSAWGCERASIPAGILTPEVYQHADLAYEQNSGDLFIVASVDGVAQMDYIVKENGSCTYDTTRIVVGRESEIISVGSRQDSDYVMISLFDITNNQFTQGVVWNGTDILALSGVDTLSYTETSPFLPVASSWAGTSNTGVLIYSDSAVSLNLDYFNFSISSGLWSDNSSAGFNVSGLTAFSDEEQNLKSYSYVDENKTLIIVQDDADDLWAKSYDGETNTWSEPDGGSALETTVSSTSFPTFDFIFDDDRGGPSIEMINHVDYVNSSDVFLNITLQEEGLACSYSLDGGNSVNLNKDGAKIFSTTSFGAGNGNHNVSFTCEDEWENSRTTSNFSFVVDTLLPLVSFTIGTVANNSDVEIDWIFANVTISETNFANVTYTVFNSTGLVNQTTYPSLTTEINWTELAQDVYYYNVTVVDLAGNTNFTETRTINLTRISPVVNLVYPLNNSNFTSYELQLNFSAVDELQLINCSLWGNWTGIWHLNTTINNPSNNTELNFSGVNTTADGFYKWNIVCYDNLNTSGTNSSNYTFSTFLPPESLNSSEFNATQSNTNGSGNITLIWNSSLHATKYRIYYSPNNLTNFTFLNETTNLNYTDTGFSGNIRRFYRVDAWNPGTQNNSSVFYGAHVYTLKHSGNTRNILSFPTNFSYLYDANKSLESITNATAFTMWNATLQQRVTCNNFTCPHFPSCTLTSCNFDIESGQAYEVNINSSAPSSVNWSGVGIVYNKSNINLVKNATSFGKNWLSMYANTSLISAQGLINNITNADAVSIWNETIQKSQGYVYVPAFGIYVGTNFSIQLERGYEVSVNATTSWTQN